MRVDAPVVGTISATVLLGVGAFFADLPWTCPAAPRSDPERVARDPLVRVSAEEEPGAEAAVVEEHVREGVATLYVHGVTPEVARAAVGVQGLPVLRRLLLEAACTHRDNVVAFLGELGGSEDAAALVAFLQRGLPASYSPADERALLLTPRALGSIAHRGDSTAMRALLSITEPDARGGSLVAGAVASAEKPALLRQDLIEAALSGLAEVRTRRADTRLQAVESGQVIPWPQAPRSSQAYARALMEARLESSP